MSATIHVDIVSAEQEIFAGEAELVTAPGLMGEIGVRPRHTPLLTPLAAGEVKVSLVGGDEESFYVSGGMLEVQPHVVTVLSDTALRAADIDEAAALRAKEEAEREIADKSAEMDYAKAQAQLAAAAAQLQTVERLRKRAKR